MVPRTEVSKPPILKHTSNTVLRPKARRLTLPELKTGDKARVVKIVLGRREDKLISRTDKRSGINDH